ncbi:universal stress protein [Aureibaculum luteum]|uniref:universal stress protein n=1 Tax=Aureibaculum luteum TaxID=1548456 RepID=UPI000E4A7CD6|nr:universal stress protein [Aureibaculum luteum]
MKTIIHATDFSENAIAALKYAHALSSKLNANLLVVHIFDYPTIFDTEVEEPVPDFEKVAYQNNNELLVEYCTKHLGNDLERMNVKTEAIENMSVTKAVISKVIELNAFLLVTGMKGTSAFKEFIMGNTTKKLIKKAPCPVLAIPEDATHKDINTIVYATDFEYKDLQAILTLIEIAKPYNAEIKVVHISPSEEFDPMIRIQEFEDHINDKVHYPNIIYENIPSDHTFEDLKLYLGEVNVDIIAVLKRKRKGLLKQLFHHDLVIKMESYGRLPLLSFNKTYY